MKRIVILLISLISLQLFAMEESTESSLDRSLYLTNQSGHDVYARLRLGPDNGIAILVPENNLKMINGETFLFENGKILTLKVKDIIGVIRIRFWPTSYTPTEDVDESGKSIQTSVKNAEKSLYSAQFTKPWLIEKFNEKPISSLFFGILNKNNELKSEFLDYNKPASHHTINKIKGLKEIIEQTEDAYLEPITIKMYYQ